MLKRQPRWDGATNSTPLSYSNAIVMALKKVAGYYSPLHSFKVEHISMWNLGWSKQLSGNPYCSNIWYYFVAFEPTDKNVGNELSKSQNDFYLDQIVMMDGTIAKCVIQQDGELVNPFMIQARRAITDFERSNSSISNLPSLLIQKFHPKTVVVTNGLLVLFANSDSGIIINPTSRNSIRAINGFEITPGNYDGVFDFKLNSGTKGKLDTPTMKGPVLEK